MQKSQFFNEFRKLCFDESQLRKRKYIYFKNTKYTKIEILSSYLKIVQSMDRTFTPSLVEL